MLLHGDCLEKLKELADNSVDSIVTDPPYGLSFMGKKWDYDVPSTEIWQECLRVLKPGGHLLAFFGTRTYHRGVVRIEDAGFEIRDQIMWIYGSGFPKSQNVALAIDKQAGVLGHRGKAFQTAGAGDRVDIQGTTGLIDGGYKNAITDSAKQWQGWGTALKPANEPIVVARKPLEKGLTVAENVQKWGTGALNIDGSRIEAQSEADLKAIRSERPSKTSNSNEHSIHSGGLEGLDRSDRSHIQGCWPANIIFDEEAAAVLDQQSGQLSQCGGPKKTTHDLGMFGIGTPGTIYREENRGASRFFYVAKASKRERNAGLEGEAKEKQGARPNSKDASGKFPDHDHRPTGGNNHPTVKPIKLMQYLITLVTPPNGTVLDPFMGSGSTGVAAKNLNREFIGIELSEEYFQIARKRLE